MTVRELVRSRRGSVLEVAAEVLVARPTASLAEVARAAGIGRTTLHKQYATRDDLLVAVAHRGLDLLHAAVADVELPPDVTDPDAVADTLDRLVGSFVPLGPELAFLLRQPSLDDEPEVQRRFEALEPPLAALVRRGQQAGLLRTDMPDAWFVATLYAQVYVAWEGVATGWLAPRDAPDLVVRTLLEGLCGTHCPTPPEEKP
jgi:AcrR family transcriptional regulator